IAAVDRERFYIANDHGSTTALGRALDDYLVLPRANLLYFDGTVFRAVAQHMAVGRQRPPAWKLQMLGHDAEYGAVEIEKIGARQDEIIVQGAAERGRRAVIVGDVEALAIDGGD